MRTFAPSCALLLGGLLLAQNTSPAPATPPANAGADLAVAKTKLQGALQKSAALADTAFTVAWGPDKKKKQDDNNPFAAMVGARLSGQVSGSWHRDSLALAFDGETADELLVTGRRTLAKSGTDDWKIRTGRFADGNKLDFVPDPALLLQQLASWDLEVTQRNVGSLDDRPVEIVSVTLSPEQVAEAIYAGLLPEAITLAAASGGVFRFAAGMGIGGAAAGRKAPPAPTTAIDVAIHFDPGTNLIHQLHFRGWTKADAQGAAGVVMVQGGGGGVRVGGADDDEEDEEETKEAAAKTEGPLVYENGLPVRPRKKISVSDCTIRFTEHGQKSPAPLTDKQKQLLGR
jgi:hypothetical protein